MGTPGFSPPKTGCEVRADQCPRHPRFREPPPAVAPAWESLHVLCMCTWVCVCVGVNKLLLGLGLLFRLVISGICSARGAFKMLQKWLPIRSNIQVCFFPTASVENKLSSGHQSGSAECSASQVGSSRLCTRLAPYNTNSPPAVERCVHSTCLLVHIVSSPVCLLFCSDAVIELEPEKPMGNAFWRSPCGSCH